MKPSLSVGVIGHWGGNVGHDIMALGIECILRDGFDGRVAWQPIEQHRPLDIYPRWHPLRHAVPLRHGRGGRIAGLLKRWINRRSISRLLWRSSWVGRLDLGLAAGGPLITPHMSRGDLGLMFHHVFGAFASHRRAVVNLSVGSCYPWEAVPSAIAGEENRAFLRRVFEYSRATTVRDELAQRLCLEMGQRCELVPDLGFVAGAALDDRSVSHGQRGYVVINYQRYGANEDWGQGVDPDAWRDALRRLIDRLESRHEVAFICHSESEAELATGLDPAIPRYRPKSLAEYGRFLSRAIAGVCNRIHAAVPLASVGVPAIGVGTDSRLGTLRVLGLPAFYVKHATAELLEGALEDLIGRRATERERLLSLREEALKRYVEVVRSAVVS